MEFGDVVFENSEGKATFHFKMEKDGNMYRCEKVSGEILFTNKMEFIEEFLKERKQLKLF